MLATEEKYVANELKLSALEAGVRSKKIPPEPLFGGRVVRVCAPLNAAPARVRVRMICFMINSTEIVSHKQFSRVSPSVDW